MSFFYAFLVLICMLGLSYFHMKTYQLDGYNIGQFFNHALSLQLAFGKKNRLIFTKRVIRFICTYVIVIYALLAIIFVFSSHWLLILMDIVLLLLLIPFFIILIHYLLYPIELLIKKYYMHKASKKLAVKNCIKIGITGSFGKTSTKNILYEILSKQYKVCVSPANYNTEMGLTKTILEKLDDDDILIAEMGARKRKDIEILTRFINPDYAILTTVGGQHLDSFKTLENIENTKFELLEYMKQDGIAVINGDSKSGLKLYQRCKVAKFLTCTSNSYAYAKDIVMSENGSEFTLVLDGNELNVKTKLLGKCNIDNIVTATALGYILKIGLEDIKDAIFNLEPTPHRLELIKNEHMCIIDDSYNSNLIGATEALSVLTKFEGRKIVITPGFVEMGQEQDSSNFRLGAEIADSCDYVIIMNELNKHQILAGLISHNFNQKRVFFAKTRKEQTEILKKLSCEKCVVLFENDLPDNFE